MKDESYYFLYLIDINMYPGVMVSNYEINGMVIPTSLLTD